MQFSILLKRTIQTKPCVVWQVLNDTESYGLWNPFVIACESSFEPNSSIVMKVKLLPLITLKQTETVRINKEEQLLEYGIHIPGLLHSSRKHVLQEIHGNTEYESSFQLTGLLAPVVGLFMSTVLNKGFTGMTDALVNRAETIG